MEANSYKHLHFIKYKGIVNWSVQYTDASDLGFTRKYPMVKIGSFLNRSTDLIAVKEDAEYKQVTLRINNGGVVPRNNGKTVKGSIIGTKRQTVIHSGQFIMSKIDARNGAYGIVPEGLDGAIVTNDFPVFNVDTQKIVPQFLVLVSTTEKFIEFARKCSSGTTNRKRIDINAFLQQSIPLPSLGEQKKIIDSYNNTLAKIDINNTHISQTEVEIEHYLLSSLGLTVSHNLSSSQNGLLKLYSYSQIGRWDCYNSHNDFILKGSRYPIVELGEFASLVARRWDRKRATFRYVEIGSVDSFFGIQSANELPTNKAPSRATQIIKEGDLIIGTTRPYLKKFATVSSEFNDCVCSSGFQVIAPNSKCNLYFILEFLKTEPAIAQFNYYMTGALYPAITTTNLKKIRIPLPPIDIQNSIANHIMTMKIQINDLRELSEQLGKQALVSFEKQIFDL